MENDFAKIVLLKNEERLFRKFTVNNVVNLSEEERVPLALYNLIQSETLKSEGRYVLSDTGKRYREYLKVNRKEKITTRVIAITALVLAALSIAAQIWTALLQRPQ